MRMEERGFVKCSGNVRKGPSDAVDTTWAALWDPSGPGRTPPSPGPIWSSAKHCLSEGCRVTALQIRDHLGLPRAGLRQLRPGETRGEEEAGEGAEAASHDSPTSTQSARWHLRSPAPNSNLVRLLEAESAPARHESSVPRGSLPETLAPNQGSQTTVASAARCCRRSCE